MTRGVTEDGTFAAFRIRHFGLVWISGLLWHVCRWAIAFLGTYLINEISGSPRLVQLAGTVLYAPLLLGGVAGGVISDRWDRLLTVRVQMAVLAPLAIAVGLFVRADRISVALIYIFMFIVGLGWVSDMTSRRALVFDLVGPERLDKAMAMEALSLSLGMVIGALVGGYAIDALGIASSYMVVGVLSLIGFAALVPVQAPPKRRRTGSDSPIADLRAGLAGLRRNSGLRSILGVTVIANMFQFSYFPIIPVIAEDLGAEPFFVGLLAAATGMGMMTGSLLFARNPPSQRGRVYIGGVATGLLFLLPFAFAASYALTFAALVCSGIGAGLFGATQSTLVMESVTEEMRGRALGLLSMAIGALPIGMYVLGEMAEQLGVTPAILVSAVAGLLSLALWMRRRPEVLAMHGSAT